MSPLAGRKSSYVGGHGWSIYEADDVACAKRKWQGETTAGCPSSLDCPLQPAEERAPFIHFLTLLLVCLFTAFLSCARTPGQSLKIKALKIKAL